MSSTLNHRSMLENTALASWDPIIFAFIDDLRRAGFSEHYVSDHHPAAARHFLLWLHLKGIELKAVDGSVIDRFVQHDCNCFATVRARVRLCPWRKRRTSPHVMNFVRFLERTGRIDTPGDLDDNFRILDGFLERLRGDGYAPGNISSHYAACANLIVWLHLSRIRLRDMNLDVYARFRDRQFICSIPGVFCGQRKRLPKGAGYYEIGKFLGYLVATGQIAPFEPVSENEGQPVILAQFSAWLERNRGICATTIRAHIHLIETMLPILGEEPRSYDAATIRRAIWEHMRGRTQHRAQKLAISMRMYLRFLVSEGHIAPALVEAVPTMPRWRLATLPRYISIDDVERTISSCGDTATGVRDRAILLLLARLGLRAGDIIDLRLSDIDWDKAQLHVWGKFRRQAALPLPQDAGDALYAYIATARPRTDEEKVFLRAIAPIRPLSRSGSVSFIVRSALDRAGVTTFAGRGAHVLRHSQATELLRSGATLDVIGSLLRHGSSDTTMIYAKTDVEMLQEVAQPWIGGLQE